MKKETKLVGVQFDRKQYGPYEKVYYYRTNKDLKVGDKIEVKAPTGGKPDVLVIDVKKNDTKRDYKRL